MKDGGAVERMASVDTLLMDKTGTVTTGRIVCHRFESTSASYDTETIASAVSAVESRSEHPLGKAVTAAHQGPLDDVDGFEYIPGRGVSGTVRGMRVTAGNEILMRERCPANLEETLRECDRVREEGFAVILAGIDGMTVGFAILSDTLKEESIQSVADIKELGIRTIMLTGDDHRVARKMTDELGMDDVVWECLPEDKLRTVTLVEESGSACMVGDGINDAPVMAAADCAVSMGKVGSDAAIEASDVVLVTDNLELLPKGKKIARATRSIVFQNIIGSLLVKLAVMVLGIAIPSFPLILAVVADVGVMLVAVLNAMRTKLVG